MRWLRGLYGTLRLRANRKRIPVAPGPTRSMTGCYHPQYAITACTYQVGPYGRWGWFCRCKLCGAWFAC